MRKIKLVFLLTGFFSILVFLVHFWTIGSSVWGDGQYYYSYLRSLVIDRNLNLEAGNKYSIGPSIFWLPFFILAHIFIHGNGYELPYQLIVGIASGLIGVSGLFLCFLIADQYFGKKIALLATMGIWLGSDLFFYTSVDPVNSHSVSFFTSSLLVFLWLKYRNQYTLRKTFILGLTSGVLAMVRSQDIIFTLPIILDIGLKKNLWSFVVGLGLGFLPQLVMWQKIFGEIRSPYLIYGHQFFWQQPKIIEVLFSKNNGLLSHAPILILALLGMKKTGYFLFLLQLYIVSCWFMWWGGAGYGGRMFISLMPFFILDLAHLIRKTQKYIRVSVIIILLLIIQNFYSMVRFLILSP